MTDPGRITPRRLAALVGVILLTASPALALGQWYRTKGPLETLAWFDQHRTAGDSAAYASAQYHAGHARASHSRRWSVTGYATLGLAGTLAGMSLLLAGRRRRAD